MEIKNLNEVCMINMGQSPDSSSYNDKKEGLAFYQGNADFGEIHPTTRVWCNNPIKIAEKDDILISVRAPIGSMNIANEKCCIGRGLASIKPIDKNECNQNYLYYFLESKVPYMQSKGTGSTFKAINKGILTSLQIKLPNIREQEKISSIISKIKAQIHNKKLQIRKYDELVKSQFIEMFGTSEYAWKHQTTKLENLASFRTGGTPDRKKMDQYIGTIPWITTLSLGESFIGNSDAVNYISQKAINESSTHLIPANSVMLGIRVGVGKSSINKEPICTNQDIVSIYNIKDEVNSLFLKKVLDDYEKIFNDNKRGATIKGVTTGFVKNLDIPTPPIELQNQFADFVKHIDKLKYNDEFMEVA